MTRPVLFDPGEQFAALRAMPGISELAEIYVLQLLDGIMRAVFSASQDVPDMLDNLALQYNLPDTILLLQTHKAICELLFETYLIHVVNVRDNIRWRVDSLNLVMLWIIPKPTQSELYEIRRQELLDHIEDGGWVSESERRIWNL